MSLQIIKPGIQATIQDMGRIGFQAQGVPVCGAMDKDSFIRANLLAGNYSEAPCLEFALHGLEIVFEKDTLLACCGGGAKAFINDKEIPFERSVLVKEGSVFKTKAHRVGMWGYLSVGGGFHIPRILNSASTYLPAGFGGIEGRKLKADDRLLINPNKSKVTSGIEKELSSVSKNFKAASWGIRNNYFSDESNIRIFAGGEWDWLDEAGKKKMMTEPFKVSVDSNRMGYRLSGFSLTRVDKRELLSTAVTAGTVQLTHEGSLIVLMADGQTVGGYPRVAQVAAVDLPKLAQKRAGEPIHLQLISFDDAERLFLAHEKEKREIMYSIQVKYSL